MTLAFAAGGQDSLVDASFQVGAGANGAVNAILVQPDGKILVGGDFTEIAGSVHTHLARLCSDGRPDESFTTDTDGTVWHLLEQPDGKILVAGDFTKLRGVDCIHLGRLLPDGSVDSRFTAPTNFADDEGVFTIALQNDGKIVVANVAYDDEFYSSKLTRLTSDGQPDDSFVNTNIFSGWLIHSLLSRTNGTIWVGGGFLSVNGTSSPGLVMLDAGGRSCANSNPFFAEGSDVFSLAELTNGNVLVGGLLWQSNAASADVLVQIKPSGERDTNFITDKFARAQFGGGSGYVTTTTLQPDGKILIGGQFYDIGGYWRRHVARLDTAGHVDPAFDPGMGLDGFYGAQTLARQPDGRVLVGGEFNFADATGPANLARLLPQSDADMTRVYLKDSPEEQLYYVAGTYPPGGTNYLQFSTNLVDWTDILSDTGSYLFYPMPYDGMPYGPPAGFFRVKKCH